MASSRAIEAAKAFVRITADDSGLRRVLGGVTGLFRSTAAGAGRILGNISQIGFGNLLAQGISKATSAVFDFAKSGAAIDDMSKRTGASAEALSQLKYAAEQSGSGLEDVEKGMRKLADVTTEAGRGGKTAALSLDRIGLSAAKLEGLSPEQRLLAVAEGLSKVEDPAERSSLAMDLLGKSGANLLPMMEDGAGGIQKLMTEADKLGLTLTGDQAAAAAGFDDAWAQLTATASGAAKILGAALAPSLTWLMQQASSGIPILVELVRVLGNGIVTAAQSAFSGITMLLGEFPGLMSIVTETFGAIKDALSSGDYALAARILWLSLKSAWLTGIDGLNREWLVWKKAFLDTFGGALSEATKKWHTFQNYLSKKIVGLMSYVDSSINVDDVNAELDVMLQEQLQDVDSEAAANKAARDAQFESDIGQVNTDLEAARAEWAAAVNQATTQAGQSANEPIAQTADDKFTKLINDMKTGDIASRIESTVKSSGPAQDLRSVSGASQLTSLINGQGTVQDRQLSEMQKTRQILGRLLIVTEQGPEVVSV